MTGLTASIAVERGRFALELDLAVAAGTVTAIVGPNGAGKTTALHAIAGLVRPGRGRITLDGRVLDDAATGIHVRTAQRGIGVVFQDYLLFPHLSALENVAFGLIARGVDQRSAHERAAGWLSRLGLSDLASARPNRLSGGQAQRVALARALIIEPALLLLDEPLAALDASVRPAVRADLGGELRAYGGATVIVSHDPIDALALADDVLVLDAGRVAQRGSPLEVSTAPASEYVARLVGLNFVRLSSGGIATTPPSDVTLSIEEPRDASSDTTWRCTIVGIDETGHLVRVNLARASDGQRLAAELRPAAYAALRLRGTTTVWAALSARPVSET